MAILRACVLALCLATGVIVALAVSRLCHPGGRTARALGRLFCRLMLFLLRVEVVVTGTPPRVGGGVLLSANHVSWIDPLVLFAIVPAAMLAKREVGTWPGIAALARLQATVLVDRSRRMRIPQVNSTMADRLTEGSNVLLFPEGTTYDGSRRGRFLTSHLACLVGVGGDRTAQAVALAYSDPAAAWIGDDTLLPHLWSVLRRPPMTCTVAFGAPVAVASAYDRKALGRQLAGEIEDLLAPATSSPAPGQSLLCPKSGGLIMTQA